MICARRVLVNPSDVAPVPRRNFSEVLEFQTGMEYFGARTSSFSWGVWSYLLRRSVVSLFHLSFEDINYVEDRLFLLNLLPVVKRVSVIDVDLYYYVQHESSISHSIRKKHGTDFIDAWLVFMDYLHSLRDDPSISRQVAVRLQEFGYDASFSLFMNACRYCPIDVTKQSFISLSAMGFYPIEASFYGRARLYKNLINHKGLWLLLCRILHLLPMSLRVHM